MFMFHKCKITVLEKKIDDNLIKKFLADPSYLRLCDEVEIGQEFYIDNPFKMPDGICASAWADIRPHIISMANGGTFNFLKHKNVGVAICTDPFRPVTFKIERMDD